MNLAPTLLTGDEFTAMGEAAVARGLYRNDPTVFTPGMGWLCPWVYDPVHATRRSIIRSAGARNADYLSTFYWRDWGGIRAPICIVCPNGEWWEIDRRSSNGPGWVVTGEWPSITITPSIVVNGYHGMLTVGVFGADLEGRGENGTARPTNRRAVSPSQQEDKPT